MNKRQRINFINGELLFGSFLILVFLAIAILAPVIAPPDGDFPEIPFFIPRDGYRGTPQPPNPDHILGTLPDQYDVFYGLIWGTRRAFLVGIWITLGRTLIGVLLGLISGYYKGITGNFIMRIADAFMSMPSIAAAALMFALFGEVEIVTNPMAVIAGPTAWSLNEKIIVFSLILFGWMQYARIIHANVLSEREKDYVQAAISIGSPHRRIVFKHILPNATKGFYVLIASDIGGMVAVFSLFYFIGLIGISPYGMIADWGLILSVSRDWIVGTPSKPFLYWYTYFPAISAIILFTIGWSMVGDGVRDLLDPRQSIKRRRKEKEKSIFTGRFRNLLGAKSPIPALQSTPCLVFDKLPETETDTVLTHARNSLNRGGLSEALHAYTHLIWERKNVEAVIQDIQIVTRRYPESERAWNILGDALIQAGMEEDAQQAFENALKNGENRKFSYKVSATWNKNMGGKLAVLSFPALIFGFAYFLVRLLGGIQVQANIPDANLGIQTEVAAALNLFTPAATLLLATPVPATASLEFSPTPILSTDTPTLTVETSVAVASCPPNNPPQTGKAVEIIDGNTIKALINPSCYQRKLMEQARTKRATFNSNPLAVTA
jgi:peptide/nickel transport system permease protein